MAYEGENPKIPLGGGGGPDYFTWDTSGFGVEGVFEAEIYHTQPVQPKLKHWYQGNFPGKLSGINWRIKTMDKPKVDIESVEQLRLNVKRNYPIKYSFGDLSLTFWDDIEHLSILTIDGYFQGDVWSHGKPKKGWGTFQLRDNIVIPEFKIIEYTVEGAGKHPLEYTYYNSVLSSYDFDATDDEGDEAIHTIQMVFKVEGYSLKLL